MRISDILTRERVLCDVNLASKKAALETLANLMAAADNALSGHQAFASLLARERLGGTGLGHGVALPHGRVQNSVTTTAAFLKLKQGVDYDAVDRQPVDLMFALLVPEDSTQEHLQILAQLAGRFNQPAFLARLRQQDSATTLYQLLTE
ncbi:MAG: PTS sugar transporter subunit IIA [Gammaproteobacteria bacterium]|nr:PTS sugar transporter subunit IIA [Gammaproteobacteria bacterium]